MLTARIGRALVGVAEPNRNIINLAVANNWGIAIIGALAAGKTTLLRDIPALWPSVWVGAWSSLIPVTKSAGTQDTTEC